jgi:hypothetical protein
MRKLSIFIALSFSLIAIQSINLTAFSAQSISFTVQQKFVYEYAESNDFPSTLKLKDIDFTSDIKTDCTYVGTGNNFADKYANVKLGSGRQLKSVLLKASGKISSFKWISDEFGEKTLRVVMTCTKTGKLPVVSSTSYSVGYAPFLNRFYPESPSYSIATLTASKWNVKLLINENASLSTGEGLVWSPALP